MSNACFRWFYELLDLNKIFHEHAIRSSIFLNTFSGFITSLFCYSSIKFGPSETVVLNYIVIAVSFLIITKVREKVSIAFMLVIQVVRAGFHAHNDFGVGVFDGIFVIVYEVLLLIEIIYLIFLMRQYDPQEFDVKDLLATFGVITLVLPNVPRAIDSSFISGTDVTNQYSTLAAWCLFSINCQILYYISEYHFRIRIWKYLKDNFPLTILLIIHTIATMGLMASLTISDDINSQGNWTFRVFFWASHTIFTIFVLGQLSTKERDNAFIDHFDHIYGQLQHQLNWRPYLDPPTIKYMNDKLDVLRIEAQNKEIKYYINNIRDFKSVNEDLYVDYVFNRLFGFVFMISRDHWKDFDNNLLFNNIPIYTKDDPNKPLLDDDLKN